MLGSSPSSIDWKEPYSGKPPPVTQTHRKETENHPGEDARRAPFNRLRALAGEWFTTRDRIPRERGDAQRLAAERELLAKLFAALGYALQPCRLPLGDFTLPALGTFGATGEPPRLVILHAWDATREGEDALTLRPSRLLWDGEAAPAQLTGLTWQELLSDRNCQNWLLPPARPRSG